MLFIATNHNNHFKGFIEWISLSKQPSDLVCIKLVGFRAHIGKCKFYFVVAELIYSAHDEDKINFKLEHRN